VIEYTRDGLRGQVADISRLARVEGLAGHARSAALRFAPRGEGGSGSAEEP